MGTTRKFKFTQKTWNNELGACRYSITETLSVGEDGILRVDWESHDYIEHDRAKGVRFGQPGATMESAAAYRLGQGYVEIT